MDWIRKNKFLSAYLGVVIACVGVLGWFAYSAWSDYGQTSQDYDTATGELTRLQNLKPYPFAKSKANLIALRGETAERVTELQKRLSDYEPPAERADFKPIDFQDKLRRVVEGIVQFAASANVMLPKDFYMGFEQYRSVPPDAAAAPALSRQLDAIEDLMKILIGRHIDNLSAIKRAPLPQEIPGAAVAAPVVRPGPGGKPAPAPPGESVTRFPLDITFSCQPGAFRDSLDDLVTAKRLFLVRAVQVKNQKPKGPPRVGANSPGAAAPAPVAESNPAAQTPGGDPGAPAVAEKPAFEYIVGLERLDVVMQVETIRVAPPVVPAAH